MKNFTKYQPIALHLMVVIAGLIFSLDTVYSQPVDNPFINRGDVVEETLAPPAIDATDASTNRETKNPRPPKSSRLIQTTKRDCQRLSVLHKPRADVAYVPGVDVRGKKVAPADSSTSSFRQIAPEVIEFTLQFNPLENTGLSASAFGETAVPVGKIKYDINTGALTLDGQALNESVSTEFMKACRAAGYVE